MPIDLTQTHLTWCIDIIKRIKVMLDNPEYSDAEKIEAIAWLVKQGLKVERED
jgi:hypothetical protein